MVVLAQHIMWCVVLFCFILFALGFSVKELVNLKYTKQKNLVVEETIVVTAHINMTAPIGTEQQLFNDDTIVKNFFNTGGTS